MIIQLCLDPLGNFDESGFVDIYTNADSFSNPLFENVAVSSMVFPNCPLNIEVPDGVSVVKIFDELNYNCVYIPVTGHLCEECIFDFDVAPTSEGPSISCGNLISQSPDCVSSDWDLHYRIEWINESSEVVFVSGYGAESFTFDYQHPLTGNNSVPVPPGVYTPILTHIWVNWNDPNYENGIVYTGVDNYTGTLPQNAPLYVMPLDICLNYTVDSFGLSCANTYNPYGEYTHSVTFEGYGNGEPPYSTSFNFNLSSDVKYFAVEFKGNDEPDTFKLTLHTSSYDYPIILEWLKVGDNVSLCEIEFYSHPQVYRTDIFKKVILLEQYNISDGDYIEINVQSDTPYTEWTTRFKCITEELECDSCIFYEENKRKILINSFNTLNPYNEDYTCDGGATEPDGKLYINFDLKSCHDFTGTTEGYDNDFIKYYHGVNLNAYAYTDDNDGLNVLIKSPESYENLYDYNSTALIHAHSAVTQNYTNFGNVCYSTENESLITYNKLSNQPLTIHLQDETLFNLLVEHLTYIQNDFQNYSGYDPTQNIKWYTNYIIYIPYNTNGSNWGCGDGISQVTYRIHHTCDIEWGELDETTKYITIYSPFMENQLPYDDENDPCNSKFFAAQLAVNQLNNSNNTVINVENYYSLSNTRLIRFRNNYNYVEGNPSYIKYVPATTLAFHKSMLDTIPLNAETMEIIPSLSSTTCENLLSILPQLHSNNFPSSNCDNAYDETFYGFIWTWYQGRYIGPEGVPNPMNQWAIWENVSQQYVISGDTSIPGSYTIINPNYVIQ